MDTIIAVKNLQVHRQNRLVLDGITFALLPGQVLGIIGPNGSGKTTTLSCIEGLLRPSAGTVRVFSLDPWTQRRRVACQLGVQLQATGFPLRVRVGELCRLFASFYAQPLHWEPLLEALGLGSLHHRSVQTLSGGERQRLSILLALIGRPELLVLDEVSTGLAPEARHAVRSSLRQIADSGIAMVVATHYPDELPGLADQLLLLDHGQQRFLGPLEKLPAWAQAESGAAAEVSSLEQAYLSVCQPGPALHLEGSI